MITRGSSSAIRLSAILVGAAAAFAGPARAAEPASVKAAAKKPADAETVRMVEDFVKSDIADLPPDEIPEFIKVDPGALPAGLRTRFLGRREELLALKKIEDGKRKPAMRDAAVDLDKEDACKPMEDPKAETILKLAGYGRIDEHELDYIKKHTDCDECELAVEFTLRMAVGPKPLKAARKAARGAKTGDAGKAAAAPRNLLYFLHEKDPLWNLVGACRAGIANPFGTNFFGTGHPSCRKR